MTQKDEALRMAIKALEYAKNGFWFSDADIAIQACKAALSENKTSLSVEQDSEPVLYWNGGSRFCTIKDINFDKRTGGTLSFGCDIPLYTSPPKREWRGLAPEVIDEMRRENLDDYEFAKAIEAKLKEVNGYA